MRAEYILKVEQDVCPQCRALEFILMATPEITGIKKVNIDHELTGELGEHFGTMDKFVDHYGIMGTPTLLFLDADFNELGRIVGAKGITPDYIREKLQEQNIEL
jgi:hypothetical protein